MVKPQGCAMVIDAMALVQGLLSAPLPNKFGSSSWGYIQGNVTQYGASRVDFVGDQYDAASIKGLVRSRRN